MQKYVLKSHVEKNAVWHRIVNLKRNVEIGVRNNRKGKIVLENYVPKLTRNKYPEAIFMIFEKRTFHGNKKIATTAT